MAVALYNEAILRCLKTGVFRVKIPLLIHFEERVEGAEESLDYLGLNYYSHLLLSPMLPTSPPRARYAKAPARADVSATSSPSLSPA